MEEEEITAKSSNFNIKKVPCQALIDNDEYSWMSSGKTFFENYNFANGNSRSYTIATTDIDTTLNGVITVAFAAASKDNNTSVQLSLNGNSLGLFSLTTLAEHDVAVLGTKTFASKLFKNSNVISIRSSASHDARLDYIKIDYYRKKEKSIVPINKDEKEALLKRFPKMHIELFRQGNAVQALSDECFQLYNERSR